MRQNGEKLKQIGIVAGRDNAVLCKVVGEAPN